MDSLADKWLGHKPIQFKDVTGSGKSSVGFDQAPIERATCLCRRGRRCDAAALAGAEAAARRQGAGLGLRAAGTAAGRGAEPHGAARHFDRPADTEPAIGRAGARRGCARGRDLRARRRAVHDRLAKAARRHPVRQDGPARRLQDQDRPVVDHGAAARRAGGRRPRAAAQDRRLAPDDQAQIDLYRRAAGLHPPRHQARPHLLCAGRDDDRAAVLVRAEPAEHPGAHGGRPQDQDGLHRRQGQQADLGRLQPDRAQDPRPRRRDTAACARPSPTASTSMR